MELGEHGARSGRRTGKLTRLLVTRVGRVIALDTSPAMLAELRGRLPGVEAPTGPADRIPPAGRSVDAAFGAEAFHWFGTAPRHVLRLRRLSPQRRSQTR